MPAWAGGDGGSSGCPVTSLQRAAKCAATSATAGPRRRVATSCQPIRPRIGCSLESKRSPPSAVRSIPPTKATSPSMIAIFSWWQCSGRSLASSAHSTRVPRVSSSRTPRTAERAGLNSGSGAPAQSSTRTLTRSASSPSRSRSRAASSSRVSPKSGLMYQPAMCTLERAPASACASSGSACAPSISTSRSLPSRGAGPALAHSELEPRGGSSRSSCPARRSRRRWCARIADSTRSPIKPSSRARPRSATPRSLPADAGS